MRIRSLVVNIHLNVLLSVLVMCVPQGAAAAERASSYTRDGLLVNWEAGDLQDAEPQLFPTAGLSLLGSARFADAPARIELDGKGAVVWPEPIRPTRITVETVFRTDRITGPLQLIATNYPPRIRPAGPDEGNPRQWVLEIRGDPPQGASFQGFLEFGVFGEDGQWHLVMTDARIPPGWHHVIGTFDGHEVTLSVDGRTQARMRSSQDERYDGRINTPPDSILNLPAAGANSLQTRCGLEGAVALMRIYSRALSPDEIDRNHQYAQRLVPQLRNAAPGTRPVKPPFRVLFSNDFTNLNIVSPYHKQGQPFHPDMLKASVLETAGADVHMLQPAHGAVPWWRSKLYTMEEHHNWWAKHYGIDPKNIGVMGVHRYILEGGDPFLVFLDACGQAGQAPFISYRLNDIHHLRNADTPGNRQGMHAISRFYVEHPEYRLGACGTGLDWGVAAVRKHVFSFLKEICENYDLAGLELDFMRFPNFFKDEMPVPDRSRIMTQFVADIRQVLDRTAKPGQRRWLCARVPCKLDTHPDVGLDLPRLVDAGLNMVNLSPSYFTFQAHDLAKARALLPDTAIYLEMCHCTMLGKAVGSGGDRHLFLRTTDQQYYTTAHLAYRRGADGLSLFNFVYTREHGARNRGPWNEPPFHVLKRLSDPEWLAKQPQWYVLSDNWFAPLEGDFVQGDARTFQLDMSPNQYQRRDGVLRLMTFQPCEARQWMVKVNGATLRPIDYVHKPIDHPYDGGVCGPENFSCFACPRALVREGVNRIAVILERGAPAKLQYIDLALP